MNRILIGNILGFIGAAVMVAIGFIKSKKKILLGQCVQFGIMGCGNLVLGGVSGGIADFVSIARNIFCLKFEFKWYFKVLFIAIQVGFTVFFNEAGFLGWLPTAAACIFTWCLDTKNEILLKLLIILAQVMWAIYDFTIKNYAAMAFDVATMISNLIGIFMIRSKRKKES